MYTKIYSGLVFLGHDPHNEVASMANKLLDYLKHRAINKEAAAAARLTTLNSQAYVVALIDLSNIEKSYPILLSFLSIHLTVQLDHLI